MSVLTGPQIATERLRGRILIEPFNQAHIQPNSYDVTLGAEFLRHPGYESVDGTPSLRMYIPSSKAMSVKHWQPEKARPWQEVKIELIATQGFPEDSFDDDGDIQPDDLVIILMPGETILAHTNEFIGSMPNMPITTKMQARSSTGRSLLSVCNCAGLGDTGYYNRWAMEIKNQSLDLVIPLVVGQRLAQIVFMYTTGDVQNYRGRYQSIETTTDPAAETCKYTTLIQSGDENPMIHLSTFPKAQELYREMLKAWTIESLRPVLSLK